MTKKYLKAYNRCLRVGSSMISGPARDFVVQEIAILKYYLNSISFRITTLPAHFCTLNVEIDGIDLGLGEDSQFVAPSDDCFHSLHNRALKRLRRLRGIYGARQATAAKKLDMIELNRLASQVQIDDLLRDKARLSLLFEGALA